MIGEIEGLTGFSRFKIAVNIIREKRAIDEEEIRKQIMEQHVYAEKRMKILSSIQWSDIFRNRDD
jgi:hypothetical protein